ncbi:MAG: ClpXP protease specificity-enhancing factor SspB [Parvularculaceae bacterium]
MNDVEIDYDYLTQQALRRVVIDVLEMTEQLGAAPGDHHFYIEFDTHAEGVEIPDSLIEQYPQRMTIVLQHQFDDLEVREDGFSVTLWFKGKQARLSVPFKAMTSFADPSVQFGLRFDAPLTDDVREDATETETPEVGKEDEAGGAVVQLDAFRKK